MATGSSQATLPSRELGVGDLSALYEALYPVRAKYKFFGLKIGVGLDEIKCIESNNKDSESCLLEILSSRLKRKPALTCNDIDKALRSRTVDEHTLADDFQSNFDCKSVPDPQKKQIEIKKESSKKSRAAKSAESESALKMSKKESERIKRNVESEVRIKYYVESEDKSKSDKAERSEEVEIQVHERDEPKSKQAKKRARKKEKCVSIEQPEPDERDEFRIDEMKGSEKKKVRFSEMDASPRSWAEPDQKRKRSVKESETKMMDTDSESELSDTYTKKKTYSESDKYNDPQKDKEKLKRQQKQESIIKVHQKAATASNKLDSDDDDSQPWQPKRLKTMEIECETLSYYSGSSDYKSESEIPKSKYFPHKSQSITGKGMLQKSHSPLKEHERLRNRGRERYHAQKRKQENQTHTVQNKLQMRVRLTVRMKNQIQEVRMEKTQKESLQMKRSEEELMKSVLLVPVKRN